MPLNHVSLTVADRERSARFYAEHFGLTERLHDDEHLFILGGAEGSVLALSVGDPPRLPRAFGRRAGRRCSRRLPPA
ncbi:MAG TPA: VOC family protein [Solirubrobacterales bacterium]|nr:VOC family protein [Solirubrobacterales bacterium]